MAMDYKTVIHEDAQEGASGTQTSSEASLGRLEALYASQKAQMDAALGELQETIDAMRELLEEMNRLKQEDQDARRRQERAALLGVTQAQKEAGAIARQSVQKVTDQCVETIETMTLTAKRRLERLARITLPDRCFDTLKWVTLVLALVLLGHAAWQIFFG